MPYLFTASVQYSSGKYVFPSDLSVKFPFLVEKVVTGKVLSVNREGRIVKIDREIKFRVLTSQNCEITDPNPLKLSGLPLPVDVLFVAYKYDETQDQGTVELPAVEGWLLKGSVASTLQEEAARILQVEESGLLLEGTVFHKDLAQNSQTAKESLASFEQDTFAFTKTLCRRVIESIRSIVAEWKTIDTSKSLCDKVRDLTNSLFNLSSPGGAHEGITTKDETELILKTTTSLLLYCNSLLKNERFTKAEKP